MEGQNIKTYAMIYYVSSIIYIYKSKFGPLHISNDNVGCAFACRRSDARWDVKLPLAGHRLPVAHSLSHATRLAAENWIASRDGARWIVGMIRWNADRLETLATLNGSC